jgi:hypothetical protein
MIVDHAPMPYPGPEHGHLCRACGKFVSFHGGFVMRWRYRWGLIW